MNRKPLFIIFGLILTLIASACNLPSPTPGPTFTPGPTHITPLAATDTPLVPLPPTSTVPSVATPTNTIGPTPTGPTPTTQSGSGLTLDMLKNANYHAPSYNRTIKLTNGIFTEGSPATYTVRMLDTVGFGDLTGDGKPEAAVILAENGGGSGVFVSLIVMEYKNGEAHQTGEAQLGDRPQVKSVDISQGVVHLDMDVVGPGDASCCPSLPEKQNYWLFGTKLTLMRLTTTVSDTERVITINEPSHWSTVNNPFTVSGSVSVLPFENTLGYRLLLTDGTKVNEGSLMVTPTTGTTGTFTKDFDLSSAGITDWIIVQFFDVSAADGSTISLNGVILRAR